MIYVSDCYRKKPFHLSVEGSSEHRKFSGAVTYLVESYLSVFWVPEKLFKASGALKPVLAKGSFSLWEEMLVSIRERKAFPSILWHQNPDFLEDDFEFLLSYPKWAPSW